MFPEDAKDKDGQPFWSGPKRYPSPQSFDSSDPLHVKFVVAAANLIAYTIGVPQSRHTEDIASLAASIEVPTYVPKVLKVTLPGEEAKEQPPAEVSPKDEELLEKIQAYLKV